MYKENSNINSASITPLFLPPFPRKPMFMTWGVFFSPIFSMLLQTYVNVSMHFCFSKSGFLLVKDKQALHYVEV